MVIDDSGIALTDTLIDPFVNRQRVCGYSTRAKTLPMGALIRSGEVVPARSWGPYNESTCQALLCRILPTASREPATRTFSEVWDGPSTKTGSALLRAFTKADNLRSASCHNAVL